MYIVKLSLIISLFFFSCNRNPDLSGDCLSEPDRNKICTKQYVPVCGCDGKVYPNACLAKVSGVNSYSQGECSSQKD